MSREIKFRVWDSSLDSMISHELIVKLQLFGLALVPTNQTQPMQYTGLKDKNGVDIFEDDIVKRTSMAVGSHDTVGVVKELEGCWVIDSGNDAIKLWTESDQNEVIGNIHDNPELLIDKNDEE